MPFDIHWTLTVQVPQLDIWGEKLVAEIQQIVDQLVRLNEGQAQGSQAIADQLHAILHEIEQFTPNSVTQEQLDKLHASLVSAADTAEKQAADIRSNTEQITTIVPDQPPAPPPA